MAAKNTKLGRGLEAIFGEDLTQALQDIQNDKTNPANEINVNDIRVNPYQPRVEFSSEKLEELAQSIREHGVFTPILVRRSVDGYELIAGERRLRASKLAGKETIPAIIMEMDDATMMQVTLLENVQREDLNAIEEANGYYTILNNLGYTQEELAQKIGKSRTYITNSLRLRRLPDEVQQMVVDQSLSGSHVRTLLSLNSDGEIIEWARKILREKLSVHDLEKLLKEKDQPKKPKKPAKKDIFTENLEKSMSSRLQTSVEIRKNKIIIDYQNSEDLNRILELIHCLSDED